jgi:hypothetical protein
MDAGNIRNKGMEISQYICKPFSTNPFRRTKSTNGTNCTGFISENWNGDSREEDILHRKYTSCAIFNSKGRMGI